MIHADKVTIRLYRQREHHRIHRQPIPTVVHQGRLSALPRGVLPRAALPAHVGLGPGRVQGGRRGPRLHTLRAGKLLRGILRQGEHGICVDRDE